MHHDFNIGQNPLRGRGFEGKYIFSRTANVAPPLANWGHNKNAEQLKLTGVVAGALVGLAKTT